MASDVFPGRRRARPLSAVGEPGGGRLRVSGPPSFRSGGFMESVVSRLDDIEWVYRVEGDTVEDD
ncbi:hypothetical protein [Deinococcus pimensis]|uniref:hypothetical protein n=1 Tax=Deinococcus pimensis TaxID=309888 RepID=UPI0012FB959C|nr:hypothetical protein [Deinococcus pimensis]